MTRRSAVSILVLVAVLAASCADPNAKQMTSRPKIGAAGAAAERKVVLFRAVIDKDGQPLEEPWSLHFSGIGLFTVVAPKGASMSSRHSFLPGRPDASSSDSGWGFLAMPPGAYQIVFEGTAIRFVMPGAQYFGSEAVPVGRSTPALFEVPGDPGLIYIGTFSFGCHAPSSSPDALKLECNTLEILDESALARQVAQTALAQYGSLQEALATTR